MFSDAWVPEVVAKVEQVQSIREDRVHWKYTYDGIMPQQSSAQNWYWKKSTVAQEACRRYRAPMH